MRKSAIWILAAIMAIAFFGLLWMQVTYFRTTIRLRSGQFDEAVSRSLYQVSQNLENDQAKKYLEDGIESAKKSYDRQMAAAMAASRSTGEDTITKSTLRKIISPTGEIIGYEESVFTQTVKSKPVKPIILSPSYGPKSISGASFEMQEVIKQRYEYQRKIVDDVIYNLINTPSTKNIEERVDSATLHRYITNELKNNGIELPFHIEVVKNDRAVYMDDGFAPETRDKVYNQVLFRNDPIDKLNFLRIYFPTKSEYLSNEISFMLPSLIFTFILLTTFIIAIYLIFRQKRLSEMKSDFMNNMTHELKTPVSTISLAAQMLKDPGIIKSPDIFKHISGVINDETKRLSFQVEKVLQMSLFEKQKATLKFKEMDVNDIVVSVANTFQLKVEKFGGHIDIDLQATETMVNVDEMHFTNVLFNLSDNAVKYRREDVPLELIIRTWNNSNDTKVYISVEDNGIGIKKEYVKKIFERFYRVSTGNRHDVKGFGLGLAYVKKIVLDHKGTIKAESELGKGTKFIICLPTIK
ncbi:sensor histidine kinase KdpD [Dysgonomonas sp. 520]|uniref:sensor histidine kinase n=1 Tax=Dysgonomonas sp. 520 TaxID=2302931 RepID=UPI0013D70D6C|nr:HAMP domain-containing sensor histidine kinase [Dysgonomonas sp. 520]NDW10156.1 sensor histidine kinase [Dysgonomonas sp. 520]